MTHTRRDRRAPSFHSRPARRRLRSPRDAAHAEKYQWPADMQVWNWAESVVLSGYGPSVSSFLRR